MPAPARQGPKLKTRSARWVTHAPLQAFASGLCAVLALWIDGKCDVYDVECRIDGDEVAGWSIRKITQAGEVEEYHLPADFSRCNCPAGVYRPNVPCKHRLALRAAIDALEQQR